MRKFIACDESKCNGCGRCLLRCSSMVDGSYNTKKARLRLINSIDDLTRSVVACGICSRELCVEVCPAGALQVMDGVLRVSAGDCTGCGECVKACVFKAIRLHPVNEIPLACDLCSGDPECIKVCQAGALSVQKQSDLSSDKISGMQKLAFTF